MDKYYLQFIIYSTSTIDLLYGQPQPIQTPSNILKCFKEVNYDSANVYIKYLCDELDKGCGFIYLESDGLDKMAIGYLECDLEEIDIDIIKNSKEYLLKRLKHEHILGGKVEKIVYIDRNKKFNLFECSIPIEDFMGVDNYIRNYKIDLINDH